MSYSIETHPGRDSDEDHPLFVRIDAVVDNLGSSHTGVAVKDLDGLGVAFHGPVVDGGAGDKGKRFERDPFPELDVVVHQVRLYFGLHLQVENLQLSSG